MQTRQEKWIKMAKDAIAAKERAEPFQFLPEVSIARVEFTVSSADCSALVLCKA